MSASYFDQRFDVAVYGSGYAAYIAAMELHAQGKRVLLFHRASDLLWESGRSFAQEVGESDAPAWRELLRQLAQRDAVGLDGRFDGAIAEVMAASLIRRAELPTLFYIAPVAAQMSNGGELLESVVIATRSGLQRIVAERWIDASETGEIARMANRQLAPRTPTEWRWRAFYQYHDWPAGALPSGLDRTLWPTERVLTLASPGLIRPPQIIQVLQAARQQLTAMQLEAIVSHCSVEPLPVYLNGEASAQALSFGNVVCASPGLLAGVVATLGARASLGLEAARRVESCPVVRATVGAPDPPIEAITESADVAIAGAGTGGAFAAIAAARAGASVIVFDPFNFPGGIGTGGGIHLYYHGVAGGLQDEVDERVKQLGLLFGPKARIRGFHPEAKKLALMQMMEEAGVRFMPGTMLCRVEKDGRRIRSALCSSAEGAVELRANAWIDSTGDGDLCALAGASFRKGRVGDGILHAFTQSSGRMHHGERELTMSIVNYDSGWVDSTDSQDLTRARLVGIAHYVCDPYTRGYCDGDRPTYIAPAIGLRQGRHIETDYVLTLADQVEHRTFDDAIGLTAAHFDNHSVDYEFETDEAVFWVWVCRQWRTGKTACEMPYRMIIPRDLDNVWIACRAMGVSHDANYSCRQQRDIQRLGEAAGLAAAMSRQSGGDSRSVSMDELRAALTRSGALRHREHPSVEVEAGLADLRAGQPTARLWHVYQNREQAIGDVADLVTSGNPTTSWLAAAVLAAWGDRRAEPRLLRAIESREVGIDAVGEPSRFTVPNWVTAVTLLRSCGTERCEATLASLSADRSLPLNVRTAVALTIERLTNAGVKLSRKTILETLAALLVEPVPNSSVIPGRPIVPAIDDSHDPHPTREDHTWQLHLAVARAKRAIGEPVNAEEERWTSDERALVRGAFERLLLLRS